MATENDLKSEDTFIEEPAPQTHTPPQTPPQTPLAIDAPSPKYVPPSLPPLRTQSQSQAPQPPASLSFEHFAPLSAAEKEHIIHHQHHLGLCCRQSGHHTYGAACLNNTWQARAAAPKRKRSAALLEPSIPAEPSQEPSHAATIDALHKVNTRLQKLEALAKQPKAKKQKQNQKQKQAPPQREFELLPSEQKCENTKKSKNTRTKNKTLLKAAAVAAAVDDTDSDSDEDHLHSLAVDSRQPRQRNDALQCQLKTANGDIDFLERINQLKQSRSSQHLHQLLRKLRSLIPPHRDHRRLCSFQEHQQQLLRRP